MYHDFELKVCLLYRNPNEDCKHMTKSHEICAIVVLFIIT